jgi:Arc/MetJ-type ribon-helix-helix transcriptional regulator
MTTKIAISLPDKVVAAARQAVTDGRASSVSAYIAAKLTERQDYEDLATLLAEMAAEAGPTSDVVEDRSFPPGSQN